MKKNKGFTLVELLAVIVILAVILIIAVPQISNIVATQKTNSWQSSGKLLMKTVDLMVLTGKTITAGADNTEILTNAGISAADYTIAVTSGDGSTTIPSPRIDNGSGACTASQWLVEITADASPGKFAGQTAMEFCASKTSGL